MEHAHTGILAHNLRLDKTMLKQAILTCVNSHVSLLSIKKLHVSVVRLFDLQPSKMQ